MSTSGSTTYNPVLYEVVNRALRMVGAYSADGGSPTPQQQQDAVSVLNMMLKSWQTEGFMWLKSIFQLNLVAGQSSYQLGQDGTAKYWPDLTETIGRPTRLWNLRRISDTNYEVPMELISRSDYMLLPNKTTQGTVVQAYYDPQLVNGMLYVWPAPSTGTTDKIIGDCDRPIQDMLSDENTFDLPQEWSDPLSFCLAERLWFEYPDTLGSYNLLATRAAIGKESILTYDREIASMMLGRK